jgi:beta-glucosidase
MVDTAQHRAMALRAAVESLVLLKNDGTLPLKAGLRVAVIGPLGDATRVLRGNYSSANSAPPVSVVEGLRRAMPGAQVVLVPFAASITDGDPVPEGHFLTPDGHAGLRADYFNAADPVKPRDQRTYAPRPTVTRTEGRLANHALELKQLSDAYRVVWTGSFVAPETGTYRMGVSGVKGAIEVGGKPAVAADHYGNWGEPLKLVDVTLTKGARYPLHFEMESGGAAEPGLFWKRVSSDEQGDLRRAVAQADVVVAAVGLTSDLEGEEMPVKVEGFAGGDKTSLDLPADQRALLASAKALGKPLVVVAMNGSAIDLSWARDNANALIEAWYPGEQGGLAVGQVLSGAANPAGRLPLTFYHTLADLPAFDDYRMAGRTYRYFTGKPIYPFGHGLSYTSFAYSGLSVAPVDGDGAKGVHVRAQLRNTGARAGDEVVQVYLRFPAQPGVPGIALRGFQRVNLKPGETREVNFDLSPRDLSSVNPDGVRSVLAGAYTLSLGGGQPGTGAPTVETHFAIAHGAEIAR